MKTVLAVILVVLVAVGASTAVYFSITLQKSLSQSASTSSLTCTDPDSINSHVHDPFRLITIKSCVTASGIVDGTYEHPDGDFDMRLRLDPAYRNLTNIANDRYLQGRLVVEIICAHPPSQISAEPSCENYSNHIPLPQVGQHITITGPYVLDTGHGNWAEIHPVYSLVIS